MDDGVYLKVSINDKLRIFRNVPQLDVERTFEETFSILECLNQESQLESDHDLHLFDQSELYLRIFTNVPPTNKYSHISDIRDY